MPEKMGHRERFVTALNLEEPDMVPVYDNKIEPILIQQITGEKTIGYDVHSMAGSGNMDAVDISIENVKKLIRCYKYLGLDAVSVSDYLLFPSGFTPEFIDDTTFIDDWGRVFKMDKKSKTTWWVDGTVKTEEDLDDYEPPSPKMDGYMDVLKVAKEEIDGELGLIGFGHCAFTAWELCGGIDKFIYLIYENPEFAERLIKVFADANIEIAKAMMKVGIDAVGAGDDYADLHGPLMNPRLFRKWIFPHMKRFGDAAAREGIPLFKHSDGDNWLLMDDLIELGVKGFHPWQPQAMDIGEGKEKYGDRLFLLGNIDCVHVLPYGTEDDVRRDVRRAIDSAAKGGGYCLTSSNTIHANCKVENIYTMIDEARKYGRYPL